MIVDKLKIFFQNVFKNAFIVNFILKTYSNLSIILIQEPLWSIICTIPSSSLLQLKTLVLVRRRTLYRVTQENSMENSLQDLFYLYSLCPGLYYNYATLTLKSMCYSHVLLLIHYKTTMPYIYALMSYSLISVIHTCTMCTL